MDQGINGEDRRPSPDALLQAITGRGRLKIFLGAAPGVGKTYEMLTTAQARRREGLDVVIGVVETHGRRETEALLEGLEIIPRRRVEYKGMLIEEMDLEAILKRRPQLVLVDELAHTNAPESRHPKRYLDVEEILAAGIDVFTTLNIQHVESLNDVVAKITRIRVRETVPDSIIDRADEIEVIDLTPDDLIQRLKEGKVYIPHQAERAVQHYFSPGNLTALRELALRRTAQRVDEQMVTYMRSHAIPGPWATGDRVLVCINEYASAKSLIRQARRMADKMRAPWAVINVETSHAARSSEEERDRIADALRLAQRLGAEVITIPGQDVVTTVLEYARSNNFTHIVIAKSRRPAWLEFIFGSFAQKLIREARDLNVHIIAGQPELQKQRGATGSAGRDRPGIEAYAASLFFVAAALGISLVLRQFLAVLNIALVFLTAILGVAIRYGLFPALFACLASVLAYNFFFLPPLYTFTIADPENVVALFFFAVVALIASNLTSRMRAQAIAARQRAKITEELYLFSRKLAGAVSLDDVLWATAHQIALMLKAKVVLLLPENEMLAVRAGFPPEDQLDAADLAAARWSWENTRAAGRGADTLPGAKRLFLPMQTGRGAVGIIGIDRDEPGVLLTPDQHRLLDALADQAALAIERVNLAADVDRARLAAEAERLRTALLTSISHDLRTPLASIIGSASSLITSGKALGQEVQVELLRTIQEEAERLNRFISNLLDMTRLEAGPLKLRVGPAELSDLIGAALQRASKILANHRVQLDIAANLPLLNLDPVLFEQVLFNLLDNAAKYSRLGSLISIEARQDGKLVRLRIIDEGNGIPPTDLERIFDKFYRAGGADHRRAGTGLGLAICRGFVEAMGGTISAANRTDRPGAILTITLPVPVEVVAIEEATA
ncbi:MAG: sensor histidine kinase KdpD [Acetobacteraceae bacterium]|nr:sensor histidine kinase KdpD [Acetobacteraceae bacterium]MBV8591748.1 sensor histidine kinase KdpD [Acetobacteraceae bacterium]